MTRKKEVYDKKKEDLIMKNKQIQQEKFEGVKQRQANLVKKQENKREEILNVESARMERVLKREHGNENVSHKAR